MAGSTVTVTDANFENEVMKSDVPVMVDFYATWCGPCKAMAPALEAVATDLKGKVKVAKVDIDANPQLATKFKIMSVPTLMVFKGGQLKKQQPGAIPQKAALEAWINSAVA
jgi:thioredoxin 1